ncbi:TM2 domain-containing protein [Cellulophaga sp. L1A9]|uniref:TM2 domain-containing protein n=1 Tax=Cellulophaga sp. L1A9 TaxID=2686362 RepID=UPI00131AD7A8|nr:TM2 domain-containing protein [Cellulophaga sp. L1A9]
MSEEQKDLGDKAEDAFDNTKETTNDFADDAKKTVNEFSEGAKEAFSGASGDNKKVLAGLLAIFLGSFGIHKFILGYQKEGIILLGAAVIGMATSCIGIGFFILSALWIVGIIEGIIYLTKSDEEFYNTYQVGRKPWF